MTDELRELLDAARETSMSPEEQDEQRISFAYGNTHFENEHVTRETVRRESKELADGAQDTSL